MRHFETEIDRCLSEGLSSEDESGLRAHLRACERCRSYYDRQVALLRALAGNPESPTPQEQDRQVRLALRAAGLAEPRDTGAKAPGLLDRLRWARAPALAGAALLVILLAASLGYFLSDMTTETAAWLTKAVATSLDGEPVDLDVTPRARVLEGQRLEVGPDGIAELSLRRGGTVRVYPGTVLILYGPGSRLDLGRGKVWCLVEPSGVPFRVRTDLVEARVLGTSFVVERSPAGDTGVRVMEGQVEVLSLEKKHRVRLKDGWQTRVAKDKPLAPPSRYRPAGDRTEWDRKVDLLWRDIQRTFRKVIRYFEGL